MSNFLALLKQHKWRDIFIAPTNDAFLQAFRYLFVGGIATLADWTVLFVLDRIGVNKYLAACVGFCCGLCTNYVLSKAFIFKTASSRVGKGIGEFFGHASIGIVGLGLTELLLYLLTDVLSLYLLLAKAIATAITMVWNFAGRKLILYRSPQTKKR